MKLPENLSSPESVKAGLDATAAELVAKIAAIAATMDAEFAFQALVTTRLMEMSGGFKEAEHGDIPALAELAAFHLYPHFGCSTDRDGGKVQALIDLLGELNNQRSLQAAFGVETEDRELAELQVHLLLNAEIVRGTAYASQIKRRIEKIQGPHEAWFKGQVGIGPLRALQVLAEFERIIFDNFETHGKKLAGLRSRMEAQMEKLQQAPDEAALAAAQAEGAALAEEMTRFFDDGVTVMPCSLAQLVQKIPDFTRAEWDGLVSLVGLTPASRQPLTHAREIRERPLFFLSGDRFICLGSSILDALFDAFDTLTRSHLPFRDKRYIPAMSAWMETETREFLRRLFPEASVYHQLTYPDPDKPPGSEAELDVAVAWGPFLVLVEVKGKQFRPRSRLGDPARLRDDLKDNIEEAFEQATRTMRFLNANPSATFTEKGTGRHLVVRSEELRRIFPISVTLHHFGGLATQLALLKRIGLFKDSAYPWSVSLADLDVITRFAGSPDVFLHYVQRRLDLQRSEKNVGGDELDVFGLYLDSRLHPSQFWESKEADGREFTMMRLDGGSARFDEWFQAEESGDATRPEVKLELPPRVTELLAGLRLRADNGSRWIAFAVLGLSSDGIGQLEANLAKLRNSAPIAGKFSRMTFRDSDVVVSLIMGFRCNRDDLHRQTGFRAAVEKYRLKAPMSLAFGFEFLQPDHPFESAVWVEGPWVTEEVMETALREEKPRAVPNQQMPGRNDPCICGSGKKFKKCCIDRVKVCSPGRK